MAGFLYTCTKTVPILGATTLYSDGEHLVGLVLPKQQYGLTTKAVTILEKNLPIFDETFTWLATYLNGKRPNSMPAILLRGTDFQKMVWEALCHIPLGEFVTYGELAKLLYPTDTNVGIRARAIGGAVAHNPIPIIVPCHRVIGAHNNLTGYTGGIAIKAKLLALEGIDVSQLKWPKK